MTRALLGPHDLAINLLSGRTLAGCATQAFFAGKSKIMPGVIQTAR